MEDPLVVKDKSDKIRGQIKNVKNCEINKHFDFDNDRLASESMNTIEQKLVNKVKKNCK